MSGAGGEIVAVMDSRDKWFIKQMNLINSRDGIMAQKYSEYLVYHLFSLFSATSMHPSEWLL